MVFHPLVVWITVSRCYEQQLKMEVEGWCQSEKIGKVFRSVNIVMVPYVCSLFKWQLDTTLAPTQ